MRLLVASGCLALFACPSAPPPAPPASLAATVKQALAERERRLHSFHLEVDSTERGSQARHEVDFKSPNKARGRLVTPQGLELAFDGKTLVRVDHAEKTYEVVSVDVAPAERALFLASTFRPFVPEGYRAPLLPSKVEAVEVTHPKGPRAAQVTVRPGAGVVITYVLRLPSGDFLERRSDADGSVRVLEVKTERCEAALKLCVPLTLDETLDGQPLGTTTVTRAELNPELPQELFSPKVPERYRLKSPR